MENLTAHRGDSSTARHDEMNLLSSFGSRKIVVTHGSLTSEQPTVDAGQNNGALGPWDTDNPTFVSDELTRPHQ